MIIYAEPALSKCFDHFLFTDNGRDFFAIAYKSDSLDTKSICSFHKNLWAIFFSPSFQAYLLFGDEEYLFIFQEAYAAAMHYLYNDPW